MANSAYVITRVNEKFLLLESAYQTPKYPHGLFMSPGGKIDDTDKSPWEAAVREFREEVGLLTNVNNEPNFRNMSILGEFQQTDGSTCTVFVMQMESLDFSEVGDGLEIKSRKLFSVEEIRNLRNSSKMYPAQYRMICWYTNVLAGKLVAPLSEKLTPEKEVEMLSFTQDMYME